VAAVAGSGDEVRHNHESPLNQTHFPHVKKLPKTLLC
jgi:hypothetical protein